VQTRTPFSLQGRHSLFKAMRCGCGAALAINGASGIGKLNRGVGSPLVRAIAHVDGLGNGLGARGERRCRSSEIDKSNALGRVRVIHSVCPNAVAGAALARM
jgi:hypothetical protein